MKSVKNPVEIEGAREAQRRDGAAMARFLAWFDQEAPGGKLTEIDAVEALETFRRYTGALKDISFPTISGSGPNGAIVHYRVTRATNRRISPGELFLIDSGGQYEDGTTDITRTVAVGEPTRRCASASRWCSRAISRWRARCFPKAPPARSSIRSRARICGSTGSTTTTAPAMASAAICRCTKARRAFPSSATRALKRGMILSNEPGYYKTGAYGIRIENLVLVVEAPAAAGGEKPLNTFETLTLVPIDRRLIDTSMLSVRRIRLARNLSRQGGRGAGAAGRPRDAALARRRDPAARASLRRT